MDVLVDLVKFLGSLGIIGTMIRFLIDRMWSTGIEFDLETNYSRTFREVFNLSFTLIYIGLVIFILYYSFNPIETYNYDVISSGHFSIKEKEHQANLALQAEREKNMSIIVLIILVILISFVHGFFRSFWYKNYRRRAYISINDEKFYVVKRISKERILFSNDKGAYRIIELSELNRKEFKHEGIKERRNRRYEAYYKLHKDWKKLNERGRFEKVVLVLLVILLIFLIVFSFLAQENKISYGIVLIIMFSVMFLYNKTQYEKGKALRQNRRRRVARND